MVKVKDNILDKLVYFCVCVLSLGGVCVMRIIISEGIRSALKE